MASLLSAIERWDPIGLGELPAPPPRARDEAETLRSAVKAFVEAVQGLPSERADDPRGLAACLNECLQEWRDESDAAQRELESLRATVTKLQQERRQLLQEQLDQKGTPKVVPQQPDQKDTPAPKLNPMDKTDEEATLLAVREKAMNEGRALGRADGFEEGRAAGRTEGRAEVEAAAAEAVQAAAKREENLRKELRAAQLAEFHEQQIRSSRASEIASEMRMAAVVAALGSTIRELEQASRTAAEAHIQAQRAVRHRAAQMLAKKDAELARLRRGAPAEVEAPLPKPQMVDASVDVDFSPLAALRECNLEAAGSWTDGAGEANSVAVLFAKQVATLETKLAQLRERNAHLEAEHSQEQAQAAVLKARLARQRRALERRAGTDAPSHDAEYLHNVMLRWFTLNPSERVSLFPVVATLCQFSPSDVAAIKTAQREHEAAASTSSWLWAAVGRSNSLAASSVETSVGRGAGGLDPKVGSAVVQPSQVTPLTNKTAAMRTPTTASTCTPNTATMRMPHTAAESNEDAATLQQKVKKLRWLLHCANQEITRLQGMTKTEST